MSDQFWVYINEPNDKALVHEARCSFCNNGHGMDDNRLPSNGRWVGPHDRNKAEKIAVNSGKADIRWCGHCARRLNVETTLKGKN